MGPDSRASVLKPVCKARRWLGAGAFVAALLCPLLSCAQAKPLAAAQEALQTCIQGTFIQLAGENTRWDKPAWRAVFKSLQELQIRNLILQWVIYDDMAFYSSHHLASAPAAPLETILDLAEAAGMRVTVGLSHDSAYWSRIKNRDKQSYFATRLRKNIAVAAELLPLVSGRKSFAGWYISEEIDDINWQQQEDREILFAYLKNLSDFLRSNRPDVKVGVSGFANYQTAPSAVESFWTDLLGNATGINTVYFQDGIGVAKLDLKNLGNYYQAIRNATKATRRDFIPIIEAFEQTSGAPIFVGEFSAVPTNLPRLLRQIQIAERYSVQRVAFGIPEYLTPSGGAAADAFFNIYLGEMQRVNARCNAR